MLEKSMAQKAKSGIKEAKYLVIISKAKDAAEEISKRESMQLFA